MNQNNPSLSNNENKEEKSFIIENLCSCEHIKDKDGNLAPLLNKVSFSIDKKEVVGLTAIEEEELFVLIEILGNMRPYYSGYVKLSSYGTKAKKKSMIEQIFYLDSSKMLYMRMRVLEHLMFVSLIKSKKEEPSTLQKEILDLIDKFSLQKYVLKRICELDKNKQFIISIFIACLSSSEKIVINAINYNFDFEEANIINKIFTHYSSEGKTIILASKDYRFIASTCSRVISLASSQVQYSEKVDELYVEWGNIVCGIKSSSPSLLAKLIKTLYKDEKITFFFEDKYLYIKNIELDKIFNPNFLNAAKNENIVIEQVKINEGRIKDGFAELREKKL